MSKEYLEALETIGDLDYIDEYDCRDGSLKRHFNEEFTIVEKALQRLEAIDNANPSEALKCLKDMAKYRIEYSDYSMPIKDISEYNTIKQFLIKSQEQEKVIIELCEYCGMDNLYPYNNLEEIEITFKDTFDNYQRQRIESLGRLNKQEKVLKILFEKNVEIWLLRDSVNLEHYNNRIHSDCGKLTKEEFDLVKRYCK